MNMNSSDRQWGDYIEDIADAIKSIEEFIENMEFDENSQQDS